MFRILLLLVLIPFAGRSQNTTTSGNPLSVYSTVWNEPRFQKCNTAAGVSYYTQKEKELVWVLNMARLDPALFLNSVVKVYPERSSKGWLVNVWEYTNLKTELSKQKPLGILEPDSLCRVSALCHAEESGPRGYVGHDRFSKECEQKAHFNAECCDYGFTEAVDIVMHLLIDQDVPSLGHRHALLGAYSKVGVAIRPHQAYNYNAVLDFYF